jgi:hypothetical protein
VLFFVFCFLFCGFFCFFVFFVFLFFGSARRGVLAAPAPLWVLFASTSHMQYDFKIDPAKQIKMQWNAECAILLASEEERRRSKSVFEVALGLSNALSSGPNGTFGTHGLPMSTPSLNYRVIYWPGWGRIASILRTHSHGLHGDSIWLVRGITAANLVEIGLDTWLGRKSLPSNEKHVSADAFPIPLPQTLEGTKARRNCPTPTPPLFLPLLYKI